MDITVNVTICGVKHELTLDECRQLGGVLIRLSGAGRPDVVSPPAEPPSLESAIAETLRSNLRLSSTEIADAVQMVSPAKRNSVLSTLSRMTRNGPVRRDGKFYYLVDEARAALAATAETRA